MNGAFGRGDWVANGLLFTAYHVPWAMPAALLDMFTLAYPTKRYRSAWIGIASTAPKASSSHSSSSHSSSEKHRLSRPVQVLWVPSSQDFGTFSEGPLRDLPKQDSESSRVLGGNRCPLAACREQSCSPAKRTNDLVTRTYFVELRDSNP